MARPMTNTGMIDRVARAIFEAYKCSPLMTDKFEGITWTAVVQSKEANKAAKSIYETAISEARAAIEAMREIPPEILKASAGEDCYIDPRDGIYIDQWEAVIDAILSEKKE